MRGFRFGGSIRDTCQLGGRTAKLRRAHQLRSRVRAAQRRRTARLRPVQDQERAAGCRDRGDDLAEDSGGLTRVGETNPGAETAAAVVAGEGFPANFAAGSAIKGELSALVGASTVPGVNRENEIGDQWRTPGDAERWCASRRHAARPQLRKAFRCLASEGAALASVGICSTSRHGCQHWRTT